MGAELSRIIVVDVESTCWERNDPAAGTSEVIEIGACELSMADGAVFNKRSIVIRPQVSKVSPFCTQLTGWTQEAVDAGVTVAEAVREFRGAYHPTARDVIWASYGEYDRKMLTAERFGTDNPFVDMRCHINVKTLFALRRGIAREVGMAKALNILGLKLEGRHHNGADDACNIARILHWALRG